MNLKKIKIILIHGNGGGTAEDNWFPYLKKEFEQLGIKVVAKTFPDNDLAREKYWLPFLKNELGTDENTIIIGHSSGAVVAMRFAEENKVLGSVLVSACYTDLGDEKEKISGYYNRPWNWQAIMENQKWIIQYASVDDPYIPISEAHYVRDHLNSQYFEYADQKHFYPKFDFPEIVQVVKKKLGIK